MPTGPQQKVLENHRKMKDYDDDGGGDDDDDDDHEKHRKLTQDSRLRRPSGGVRRQPVGLDMPTGPQQKVLENHRKMKDYDDDGGGDDDDDDDHEHDRKLPPNTRLRRPSGGVRRPPAGVASPTGPQHRVLEIHEFEGL